MNENDIRFMTIGDCDLDDVIFALSVIYGANNEDLLNIITPEIIHEQIFLAPLNHTILNWKMAINEAVGFYGVPLNLDNAIPMRESREWVTNNVVKKFVDMKTLNKHIVFDEFIKAIDS